MVRALFALGTFFLVAACASDLAPPPSGSPAEAASTTPDASLPLPDVRVDLAPSFHLREDEGQPDISHAPCICVNRPGIPGGSIP